MEDVRSPNSPSSAQEGGTAPVGEAATQVPATAEREDVDSATTEGSVRLATSRNAESSDGDSAYYSMELDSTETGGIS